MRREGCDDARDREAGSGDQHHSGGLSLESVRSQPGQRIERRDEQGREPRARPAARPTRARREHRRREGCERGQEVRPAARLRERDADDDRRNRDREPQDPRRAEPPRPGRREHERRLDEDEHGVGGREAQQAWAAVSRFFFPGSL